jgi:hypothetical protein
MAQSGQLELARTARPVSSQRNTRLLVPKVMPAMGLTLNFSHPGCSRAIETVGAVPLLLVADSLSDSGPAQHVNGRQATSHRSRELHRRPRAAARLPPDGLSADRNRFFDSMLGTMDQQVAGDTIWPMRFAWIRRVPRPGGAACGDDPVGHAGQRRIGLLGWESTRFGTPS